MSKTIIHQNQTGILLRDGCVTQILSPGVYRTYKFRNQAVIVYPLYRQSYPCLVNASTADGVTIAVEVNVGVIIRTAEKLYASGQTVLEIIQQAVIRQMQAIIQTRTLGELLEAKVALDEQLLAQDIAEFGLEARTELAPRIRLPRTLQNAVDAQEVARQRAKAELEEARGRSAVIRHYANVAKVTKENPDLLRLLLGQKAKSINVAFDVAGKETK